MDNNKKICFTCGNWDRIEKEPALGNCKCEKFEEGGRVDAASQEIEDRLIYWDHDEYRAFFKTGMFFGCVHWVAK